jgi:2-oxoglutarate ferredoxin oxidoreductase subunit beta
MENLDLISPENLAWKKPETMKEKPLHYCPGCGHGTVHKTLMAVVEEMGIQGEVIGACPVGCSVFAYDYLDVDMHEAAHGRALAVATGIKRVFPEKYVFTYQGDGDLAAIGTAETIHAASRGENILTIFINNGIYGMTGGQMAPTTLPGMKSTTSPYGRDVERQGHPLVITDLLKQMPGVHYITRQAAHKPQYVNKLKKAIKKAFEYTAAGKGFCMVEVVTNCNSNMRMTPVQANQFVDEQMLPYYPLGDIKVPEEN